jgi:hypothetical protein
LIFAHGADGYWPGSDIATSDGHSTAHPSRAPTPSPLQKGDSDGETSTNEGHSSCEASATEIIGDDEPSQGPSRDQDDCNSTAASSGEDVPIGNDSTGAPSVHGSKEQSEQSDQLPEQSDQLCDSPKEIITRGQPLTSPVDSHHDIAEKDTPVPEKQVLTNCPTKAVTRYIGSQPGTSPALFFFLFLC